MSSSTEKSSRKELRTSLVLPIVISVGVLLIGWLLYTFVPSDQFNNALAATLGGGLILFLIYWTRNANWQLRLLALLYALPALAGITTGLVQGRSRFIVIGVGATFVLLVIQRAFQIPASYRVASRHFGQGNYQEALKIINKSIESRPDFAESYLLRASIRMMQKQFIQAEADAKKAIDKQPQMHGNYNTLGQIYMAQKKYALALEQFETAVLLDDANAMNQYHKGVSAYRLQKHDLAAEALSLSTKKTLPIIEFDLLAHFYLYKTLLKTNQPQTAQEALDAMQNFADGLPSLKAMLQDEGKYDHIVQLEDEVLEMEGLLGGGVLRDS